VRTVRVSSPAKINLHLGVFTQKDERGYHRVDSVMHAVSLADEITVSEAPALDVTCSETLDCPPEANTCHKAVRLFCAAIDAAPAYSIHIHKRVPSQAGLGGASANAAATLLGLCELAGQDPSAPWLLDVAASVGADVPFFLTGACAYLDRAGDRLNETLPPVDLPLVLVIPPDSGITAAGAYRDFDAAPVAPASPDAMLEALRARDAEAVTRRLSNNLDPVARRMRPALDGVREWLFAQTGVKNVMVTGSGSCTYAVCDSLDRASDLAKRARDFGWWAESAKTSESSCALL
jgi:4-diphosphocytidyl-2-C-methyl-D-erythritol kinase